MSEASSRVTLDERLRPNERLRKKEEIRNVLQQHRIHGTLFIVYVGPSPLLLSRFGVIVSRVVGKAVTRNRVKRRLREMFRRNKRHLTKALDIVIRAKPESREATYQDLEREFITLLRRKKLFQSSDHVD